MNTLSYKTQAAKKEEVQRQWYIVDATDQVLGRLASKVAKILRGKHKPNFTPHVDTGDYVIIINAEKVRLTGKKMTDKVYVRYSGYPGGERTLTPKDILKKHPERLVEMAVRGMLPKNRLGRQMFKKLFVYAGDQHPHQAQKPINLNLNEIK